MALMSKEMGFCSPGTQFAGVFLYTFLQSVSVHFCMDAFEHLVPSAVAGKIVLRLCVADLRGVCLLPQGSLTCRL